MPFGVVDYQVAQACAIGGLFLVLIILLIVLHDMTRDNRREK
jgi:hypothetical protein